MLWKINLNVSNFLKIFIKMFKIDFSSDLTIWHFYSACDMTNKALLKYINYIIDANILYNNYRGVMDANVLIIEER